jgi:hypothetical protein
MYWYIYNPINILEWTHTDVRFKGSKQTKQPNHIKKEKISRPLQIPQATPKERTFVLRY